MFLFENSGQNPFGAGFGNFRRGGNTHEVSPEDLFNMFFQGGGGGAQFHFGGGGMRNRGQQARPQRGGQDGSEQRAPQSGFQQLLQFLPILLMILMSFSSFSSNNTAPMFSLSPHGTYQREKATSMHGVSPNIKYWVNSQFDSVQSKMSTDTYRRFEKEVEGEYKHALGVQCGNEKTVKNNRMYQVCVYVCMYVCVCVCVCVRVFVYLHGITNMLSIIEQARWSNADAKKRAEELPLPSCEEFQSRFIDRGGKKF